MGFFGLWRKKTNVEGYENDVLVETILRKTAALRDAARIDEVVAGETLLPTLLGVETSKGVEPLRVLDFGGAAGFHYFVAKQAHPSYRLRWAVVETHAMAKAAASHANEELQFFADATSALDWLGGLDLFHSNSAIHYVPEPEPMVERLVRLKAPVMLWARIFLGDRREKLLQKSRLADNGPGPLPPGIRDREVTYPATRLARRDFLAVHEKMGYRLVWQGRETNSFLFMLPR